eukprot:scaffold1501_cov352-Pavlova_lutheri.AAC.25
MGQGRHACSHASFFRRTAADCTGGFGSMVSRRPCRKGGRKKTPVRLWLGMQCTGHDGDFFLPPRSSFPLTP